MELKFIETLQSFEEYRKKQTIETCKTIALSRLRLETDEWVKVDNVACVFVDLENSTKFAINLTQENMQFFAWYWDTLARIFSYYETKYIDFQGDGGFALFDSKNSLKNAFYCAVTINHFFNHRHKREVRIGIDIGTIYAKKVGVRGNNKEIWLGNPVSIASKLCNDKSVYLGNMRISSRFYKELLNSQEIKARDIKELQEGLKEWVENDRLGKFYHHGDFLWGE
ncbi:adenylate/guanylate cyclase domain-containing protein [Helicobacter cetorum]|uniref:adenylate/guanylate cyclase domain-containing protein n=1 Tax=Helicobacter cetorum TaxID=138563 RepID=UPI000CF0DDCA|nr:adenylate/guanylate cyclase domain-containing protein [Helicobacter cetorum]